MFRFQSNLDYAMSRLKSASGPEIITPKSNNIVTGKNFSGSRVFVAKSTNGKVMPFGMEQYAQGQSIYTQPSFYSPLHTPQNWQIPSKRREIYQWLRYFYENEPKVGGAIDFYSQFPMSGFETQCPDAKIKRFFDNFNKRVNMDLWCKLISKEYYLLGDVFPFLDIDCPTCGGSGQDKRGAACSHAGGTFRRIVVMNPDWIDVQTNVLADDPVITLMPDDELKRVVWYKQPVEIYKRIPPHIRNLIQAGRPIPLSNDSVSHIKYNPYPYGTYGVSMVRRLFKTLAYKDKLMSAQWIVAERLILPIRIVKIGDAERPAGPVDIADVQAQLAQVANDPNLTLVTHHAFDYDWIGTSGKILQLSNEYDLLNKEILQGLMLNEALLSGEMSGYTSAAIGAEAIIQRMESWRHELKRWIEDRIYKQIARMKYLAGDKTFVDEDATKEYGEDEGEPIYKYPKIVWKELNLRDDVQQKQGWMQLFDKGILSAQTLCEKFGLDYDNEVERRRFETAISQIGQPGAAMPPPGGAGGGMDMGGMGSGGSMGGDAGAAMPGMDMGAAGAPPSPGGDMGAGMGAGAPPPMPATAGSGMGGSQGKILSKGRGTLKPPEEEAVEPTMIRLTSLEQKLLKLLNSSNIPFPGKMQFPIGRYRVDFAYPALKLIFEADGDKWHAAPEAKAKDQQRDMELSAFGWTVVRFREAELKEKDADVMKTISAMIYKCWQRERQLKEQQLQQNREAASDLGILKIAEVIPQVAAPENTDKPNIEEKSQEDGQADQGQGN